MGLSWVHSDFWLKEPKHEHEEAQPTLVCGALVVLLGSFGEVQSEGLVCWLVHYLVYLFLMAGGQRQRLSKSCILLIGEHFFWSALVFSTILLHLNLLKMIMHDSWCWESCLDEKGSVLIPIMTLFLVLNNVSYLPSSENYLLRWILIVKGVGLWFLSQDTMFTQFFFFWVCEKGKRPLKTDKHRKGVVF